MKIFISYARTDYQQVREIYIQLKDAGFDPWIDYEDLLPGVKWTDAIVKAIKEADFYLICLSKNSVHRHSFVQRELQFAFDFVTEQSPSDIFIIPVRLDDCEIPNELRHIHCVDLFQKGGLKSLIGSLAVLSTRQGTTITQQPLLPSIKKSASVSLLTELAQIISLLPESSSTSSNDITLIRDGINEIILLQTRFNTITRPVLRELTAQLIYKEIENFRHRARDLHGPLAKEFRTRATYWLQIAKLQFDDALQIISKEPALQVFRAGDPANPDSEAFLARYAVIGELEQQVMLSTGCPGLVFYGRRRMGKSSILKNLTGFLPPDVMTAFVSMQNPQMFTSVESAVRALHDEIRLRLPSLQVSEPPTDLSSFFRFLTVCNSELEAKGKRLLLAVDEYETIDAKIGEGIFPLGLLDTLRESIQTHRRITWIFAGSHEIYELTNAPWTSYLVSARTIEVPAFTEAETRLLLTEPMKHSSLWRNNEEKRPRFATAFWGEGGIERIHAEAGGWPHLVQLIAETIVDLVNLEEVSQVTPELFERALDKSIVRGQNVLYELMHRESTLPGEWDYLLVFKKSETQAPPPDEQIAASLRRRLLIAEQNGEWRLRVPLMARWLKQRG